MTTFPLDKVEPRVKKEFEIWKKNNRIRSSLKRMIEEDFKRYKRNKSDAFLSDIPNVIIDFNNDEYTTFKRANDDYIRFRRDDYN